MKWFGRKGASASPRPPLMRGWLNMAMQSEVAASGFADGRGLVRSAMVDNPVAQRAMRLISEAAGAIDVRVAADRDADAAQIRRVVLARSAGQDLIETLAAHLLIHGEAYVHISYDANGSADALYALRPDRVSVETDASGWPIAYRYRAGEGALRYPGEDGSGRTQVVPIRALHPIDDHHGLACLSAVAGAVAIHNAATRWNRTLLDNAARPSGALIYDPGDGAPLSPTQFERLKEELETAYQGAANAGRPLLLDGGLSWQALSLSPTDMDFVALKAAAARDIALGFGVPPMLLGLPGDNSYANYREANRALWRQTVLPITTKILRALTQALQPVAPGLEITVDRDRVPELAEDRALLWAQLSAATFLSDAEKRAMLGLPPVAADTEKGLSHAG